MSYSGGETMAAPWEVGQSCEQRGERLACPTLAKTLLQATPGYYNIWQNTIIFPNSMFDQCPPPPPTRLEPP